MADSRAGNSPGVLLVNDDGIQSAGIRSLASALAGAGFCTVFVLAPDVERSAVGHGITLRETLEANLVEDYPGASLAYSLSGTPADCASLGVSGQLFPKPALVLSGINKGGNSGLPIIYSGTVAGAREAHLAGVPALSLSLDWSEMSSDAMFTSAAKILVPLIERALQASVDGHFPADFFLNVNVPVIPAASKGFKLTKQSLVGVTFKWDRVDRRTGQEVAGGRSGVALPGLAGPRPMPLPGMGGGSPGVGFRLAGLGAAAAAKGAALHPEDAPAPEKSPFKQDARHRICFRHVTGAWEQKQVHEDHDIAALADGYVTITPLALLTAAPSLDETQERASWLSSLLT